LYTYQWMSGASATCSSDSVVPGQTGLTYSPAPTTTTYYCVKYGDSSVGTPTAVAYSNVVLVTANAVPKVSPSASPNPTDVGVAVSLTGGGTGGTNPAYAWQCSDGFTSTVSPASHIFSTAGVFTCNVWYNDTWYHPAGIINVTVNSTTLIISKLTVSMNPDVLLYVTYINVSTSGGTGSLSYAYTGLPAGCTSSNHTSIACSPTATGTYTIRAFANDSAAHSVNKIVYLTVYAMPAISTFTATPNPVVVNLTTAFSVAATGGLYWLTYNYTGLPPGCKSSNVSAFSCSPNTLGDFAVRVYANDSAGHSTSATVDLTVQVSLPVISAFTAEPDPLFIGGTLFLNVSASGGAGTLAFAYAGLPAGCTTSNTPTYTCAPTGTGTFNVVVYANDTASHSTSDSASVAIYSLPAIGNFAASKNPDVVNQVTYLNVTVTGGRPSYKYSYSGLPPGECISTNTASLFCNPSLPGNYTITVTVTDANSKTATKTLRLTVYPTLPEISSFIATVNPVDVGQATTLEVTVTSGTGTAPYSYMYSGLPSGCSTGNVSALSCTPGAAGTFGITLTVTDAMGKTTASTLSLVVNNRLAVSPMTIRPNPVILGNSIQITETASGGLAPYSYSYAGLPPGCSSSSTDNLTCTPTSQGTYVVNVTVTDSNGMSVSATESLTVSQVTQPLTISAFVATPSNFNLGSSTYLNVTASGGSGSYTYFYSDLPSGCSRDNTATLFCQPTVAGTFTVTVSVNDSQGNKASKSVTFTVIGGSGTQPTSSFPWWILVVVAAALVVLLVIVVARRRRKIRQAVPEMATAAVATAGVASLSPTPEPEAPAPIAPEGISPAEEAPAVEEPVPMEPVAPEEPAQDVTTQLYPDVFPEQMPQEEPPQEESPPEPVPQEETPPEPTPPEPQYAPEPRYPSEPEYAPQYEPGMEPSGELPPPPPPEGELPPLTNCPQCMGPLTPDKICQTCGVSWVPEDTPPPPPPEPQIDLFPSRPPPPEPAPEEEERAQQEDRYVGRGYLPVDETPAQEAVSPPEEKAPEAAPAPPAPEPEPLPPPPEPEEAKPEVVAEPARPEVAPAPAKPKPPTSEKCFICGTKLEKGFCPTCNMSWEGDSAQ
jgi:hypothetical protein